jgi:beta-galactosidase GanA
MGRARENGLNCIASYVFWNLHEESENATLRWDGRRDLRRFMQEAQAAGLWVHLRLGPYVNGNWNYGGLPLWLRDKPGMQLRSAEAGWIHYSVWPRPQACPSRTPAYMLPWCTGLYWPEFLPTVLR